MARRPIFIPDVTGQDLAQEVLIDFEWYPGFSKTQAQRTIRSLHTAAAAQHINPVLEISTKSPEPLGVRLSAFHLTFAIQSGLLLTVEAAYQGSKVFERGGPYTDIYHLSGREAKRDERLTNSGHLIGFDFMGEDWPLEPKTAFYDWLYIKALAQNRELSELILGFEAFSDIAFNPKHSINCQARAAAIYVSLYRQGLLNEAISGHEGFIQLLERSSELGPVREHVERPAIQEELFPAPHIKRPVP